MRGTNRGYALRHKAELYIRTLEKERLVVETDSKMLSLKMAMTLPSVVNRVFKQIEKVSHKVDWITCSDLWLG